MAQEAEHIRQVSAKRKKMCVTWMLKAFFVSFTLIVLRWLKTAGMVSINFKDANGIVLAHVCVVCMSLCLCLCLSVTTVSHELLGYF